MKTKFRFNWVRHNTVLDKKRKLTLEEVCDLENEYLRKCRHCRTYPKMIKSGLKYSVVCGCQCRHVTGSDIELCADIWNKIMCPW